MLSGLYILSGLGMSQVELEVVDVEKDTWVTLCGPTATATKNTNGYN